MTGVQTCALPIFGHCTFLRAGGREGKKPACRRICHGDNDGKQIGKIVKVKSNGTYSITIPKQKKSTEIQLKMSKAGTMGVYKTIIVK